MPVDDLCDYITWLDKQAPIPDIDRPHCPHPQRCLPQKCLPCLPHLRHKQQPRHCYLSRLRDLQQKQEQLQPAQSPAPD